ncbi:MAG: alcohol dehydrogenase catalytic domain-containing protein [Bacillota bacterium]
MGKSGGEKAAKKNEGSEVNESKEVDKPEKKPNEALVEVKACGLCGSELSTYRKGTDVIPGHEVAGRVVEVDDASRFSSGDRVALYLPTYCGECFFVFFFKFLI